MRRLVYSTSLGCRWKYFVWRETCCFGTNVAQFVITFSKKSFL